MSKKEKLIKAMLNNPKNVDFKDIKKLLEYYDYECFNHSSSHFVFRKSGASIITIPFNRPIKPIYVKMVLKALGVIK